MTHDEWVKIQIEMRNLQINDLTAALEAAEAEVERLKAHTWEQERAAVVAWLRLEPSYQNRPWDVITADIERGEHWK